MPLMSIFEPLFLLCVLAAVVTLAVAAAAAVRGNRARALRRLRTLGIAAAAYMAIVLAVSVATPRSTYRVGDTQCFDDWCIAVTRAVRTFPDTLTVTLRVSSRAKRAPQGEKGTVVYLVDAAGHRFDPLPDPAAIPFDTLLQPGESLDTPRRFLVPADARGLGLVYTHEGGFPIGDFIIGENDWVHGPPIVRLDTVP